MSRIFVTGATGVVGSSVLLCLLDQCQHQIVVLIRSRGRQSSEERLTEVLQFLARQSSRPEDVDIIRWRARIEILEGDLDSEKLGLSDEKFSQFGKGLEHIIHSAASVDLTRPEDEALSSTLQATRTILALQEKNPDCVLQYVSTVGVNGKSKKPLEECAASEERAYFNTYEKAKAASESLIFSMIKSGRKIVVHRPSMVVGNSTTGEVLHFQVFYFILKLLGGAFGWVVIPPILLRKLDTIPCDFVAQIIFESLYRKDLLGRVLHECSGPHLSLTLSQLQGLYFDQLRQNQKSVPRTCLMPFFFFRLMSGVQLFFRSSSKTKKKLRLIPQFLDYASQDQVFLKTETERAFPHLIWPNPQKYIPASLRYYQMARDRKRITS